MAMTVSTYRPGERLSFSYQTCRPGLQEEMVLHGTRNFAWLVSIAVLPLVLFVTISTLWTYCRSCQSFSAARIMPRRLNLPSKEEITATSLVAARLELAVRVDVHVVNRLPAVLEDHAW